MKVIQPVALTDAQLISSTAAEPGTGEAAWVAATAYTLGTVVVRATTHRRYRNVLAGTDAALPELAPTRWLDIGPTNRWAMFDNAVGTRTAQASPLTVVMAPGFTGGLALLELSGAQAQITMKAAAGGTVVYSKTVSLDGSVVTDVFDWMFGDFVQLTDLVLTDLPESYAIPELTVSITGTGVVSCGVCKSGRVQKIDQTLAGPTVGIVDYSVKERDEFGAYRVVELSYSKRASVKLLTQKSRFNTIFRALAAMRATPCIYVLTEAPGFEPLLIYGFYKDFSIDVAYPAYHLCNLEIEGLI